VRNLAVFLWFDDQAQEAVDFYRSVFPDSKVEGTSFYPEGAALPAGSLMAIRFLIQGIEFTALNGGPVFEFTPAISLVLNCDSQAEVGRLWAALTNGGQEEQCGWLVDRFGVSWQVVPPGLDEMLASDDAAAAARAFAAMLTMRMIDVAAVRAAFDGDGLVGA